MPVVPIETLDDPQLDPYRQLKRSNLTRWSGLFIAEGVRLVERLLESDFEIVSILTAESHLRRLPAKVIEQLPVFVAPLAVVEQLVGFNFHNGMLACGRRKESPRVDEWLTSGDQPRLIVGCPHTADPDNLGTIIRISAALGADGVLVGSASADPFSRRTLRISMGNAFLLPLRETTAFADDLVRMQKEFGYSVFASLLDDAAVPLSQATRPKRMVLLLGNESDGLDTVLTNIADQKIVIPMADKIDSLNVGIAAGIMLHHFTQIAKGIGDRE
ncbi:TrmH family RNA methyltransferase [Planctomicrobium piriforme]|uniref:tRNA G18 (Ribose-2'-O)-methylase SpoU n=1 Tax=Planctomicrobium piriforme TaxID=1576369 RepID=A0A1I3FA84_9PLAN|nr:RNA methyltransferase [Planctomicrobium piriforme]SFI08126.1 tRNA G18 (ribose-2'-O)-methylase SpoU [Planctomicrobium piriforme]